MSDRPAHRFSAIFLSSAFVFSCRVTGAALTLLLQVLLARWMGAAELGVYVLAFSWCIMLATVSNLGLAAATLRVVGKALGEGNTGVIWGFLRRGGQIIATSSIVAALLGILIVLVARDSLPGGEPGPFLLSLASAPILALISGLCLVAVAFRWFGLAYVPTEVIRPVSIVIIVALIWFQAGRLTASTVMLVQMTLMAATALALFWTLRVRLPRRIENVPPVFETRAWIRIALPLLVISLFSNYFPEVMLILLGTQVASDQIAIFNASYRLALVVAFGLTAIDAVTAPVAARLFAAGQSQDLQSMVTRATLLGFVGSLVAIAGFAVLGPWLLGLFGPEFVAGYDTMMILILAQVVRSAAGPVMSLLSVTGHQDRCLVVFGSALIAAIALVFALVPLFGIRGAAVAVLLVTIGWSVWLHGLVVTHVGVRPSILATLAVTK